MTVVCPECGVENKKGNKFCFECGYRIPDTPKAKAPIPASVAKRLKLKRSWLKGDISAEDYRAKLLKLRLKDRFGPSEDGSDEGPDG